MTQEELLDRLILAVMANEAVKAKEILQLNANPNGYEDRMMLRPLHIAVINKAYECAKVLLAHHADINARTDEGETPLDMAIGTNDLRMIEILTHKQSKENF